MNPLPNISLKVLAAIAVFIIVASLIFNYGERRYQDGITSEKAEQLLRDNKALSAAYQQIKTLEETARETERRYAERQAAASANYQQELQHEKVTLDHLVSDLRSGVVRLRIQLANARTSPGSASASTTPAAATAGRDDETRGELSTSAAEFLVGLASEADQTVHQLTACQAVIIADRDQPGEQQ